MVYRSIVPVLDQAGSDQATFKVRCGRLAGLRGLWKAPCCSGGRLKMKRVESDMYAFTCYVALWNFSLIFTQRHQIGRKFRKKILPQQRQPKPYSPVAIFHKSITFVNDLFTTALCKGSLSPLNFRDRPKWETVLAWHPASQKKKKERKICLYTSCGPHQNQNCALGAEPGPALWHSLARALPEMGSPQQMGYSSIQFFSTAGWMHTLCHSTLQFLSNVSQQTAE